MSTNSSQNNMLKLHRQDSRKGDAGVVVFVAIGVIAVSLAIYGLFINFSIQRVSMNESTAIARAMALSAVRASTERVCEEGESAELCTGERYQLALDAALTVLRQSKVVGAHVLEEDVVLEAGQYARNNLCPESDACFLSLEALQQSGQVGQPNAYSVRYSYVFDGNRFSMIFKPGATTQIASAIATVVPRKVIFVNDMSPSAARSNYPKWQAARDEGDQVINPERPVCGRIHDFAVPAMNIENFNLSGQWPPPVEDLEVIPIKQKQTAWLFDCYPDSAQPLSSTSNCQIPAKQGGGGNGNQQQPVSGEQPQGQQQQQPSQGSGPSQLGPMAAMGSPEFERLASESLHSCSATVAPNEVFGDELRLQYLVGDKFYPQLRNDYLALYPQSAFPHPDPIYDSVYSNGPDGVWMLIDGRPNAAPEPLMTIMSAARTALTELKNRKVDGDMFSIFNYANGSLWSNTLLLTDNFDYALSLMETESVDYLPHANPEHADSYEDLVENVLGRERAVRMGMLTPGILNHTNSYSALRRAMNHLQSETSIDLPSAPMVIHFSDGRPNCVNLYCDTPPCIPSCNDVYSTHKDALAEMRTIALQFGNIGVPIHSVIVGSDEPHTRVVPKEEGSGCKTEEDIRQEIPWNDIWGGADSLSTRGFFTLGGDPSGYNNPIYIAASYYLDIMPYYEASFQKELQSILSDGRFFALRPPSLSCPDNCQEEPMPAECDMSCPADTLRLTVDPYCRSAEEQIEDFVRSLLGEIPYAIVSSS